LGRAHLEVNPILLPYADVVPIFVGDGEEKASGFSEDVSTIAHHAASK
jgi:hypothetical protein